VTETAAIVEQALAGFAERIEQKAQQMAVVRAPSVPAAVDPGGKVAKFDAEQRAAGKQMTGEAAVRSNNTHAEQLRAVTALKQYLDKDGRCASELLNAVPVLLHGFKLPGGTTALMQSAYVMTACARRAGFTQAHVDAYIRAEQELFG
jgi:hypothetical protein